MLRMLEGIAAVIKTRNVEAVVKVNVIVLIGPAMFGDIIDYL